MCSPDDVARVTIFDRFNFTVYNSLVNLKGVHTYLTCTVLVGRINRTVRGHTFSTRPPMM